MTSSGTPKRRDTTSGQRATEKERRANTERRRANVPVAVDRRKVERRINEYVLDPDVLEFINAVNEFKSVQQKPFPTWSDIYQIFKSLGYRR